MARVLVLEDDEGIRETLQLLLEDEGHTAIAFAHGADAIAFLRKQTTPLIVITDYLMPGMLGDEFLREAFASCATIPHRYLLFAAQPASKLPPAVLDFLNEHHIPFLPKPFLIEDILQHVNAPLS